MIIDTIKTINHTNFLSILINISMPALIIKKAIAHLIPMNAYRTISYDSKFLKNNEIMKIMIKEGKVTPMVENKLPKNFFCL